MAKKAAPKAVPAMPMKGRMPMHPMPDGSMMPGAQHPKAMPMKGGKKK